MFVVLGFVVVVVQVVRAELKASALASNSRLQDLESLVAFSRQRIRAADTTYSTFAILQKALMESYGLGSIC